MGLITSADSHAGRMTLTQQAYHDLKHRILSCEYMPGQDIYEKQLYEEMEYGRTPIREALLALKNENLIDIFPRRGMRIRSFTRDYIHEIYQIRKLLEPALAVQYKTLYSKEHFLEYETIFSDSARKTDEEFYELDVDFHLSFISITRNQTLISFYSQLLVDQYRLAMYASRLQLSARIDNDPQHQAIIRAMLSEDDRDIRNSLNYHLNHSLAVSLKVLD